MTVALAFSAWVAWLAFLGPEEGVLSLDPNDGGNWTGGRPGDGLLHGTKYGISAASYPTLDIADLTLEQANAIRKTDYWDKVKGDFLPAPVAFMVADAAYMSGPDRAILQLQATLGVAVDGDLGDKTIAAALAVKPNDFCPAFGTTRILFLITLGPLWARNATGWTLRTLNAVVAALAT
jgi:lysozyme family protein